MYEELIERLREYPDREETAGGYVEVDWQDLLDAADAIEFLNDQLTALSRMEAERDAAIADIPHVCTTCGRFGDCPILAHKDYPVDCEGWEWRGVQGRKAWE